MPRLRTTATLSLLLLAAGVVATGWLSGLSSPQRASTMRDARLRHPTPPSPPIALQRWAPIGARVRPSMPPSSASAVPAAEAGATAEAPISLQPLSSPMLAMPYRHLRAHRRGVLALRVSIDGAGRVLHAVLHRSSGDPVLDDYALNSVYAWRFAVPAGYADGLDGDVALRFTDEPPLAGLR